MESKSKKNISIFMIIAGLIVSVNFLLKLNNDKYFINNIIIIICGVIISILGVISLRNAIKKNNLK